MSVVEAQLASAYWIHRCENMRWQFRKVSVNNFILTITLNTVKNRLYIIKEGGSVKVGRITFSELK